MRFRLLAGQHQEPDKSQKPIRYHKDAETGEKVPRYPVKTYNPGDVIDTEKDLASMFGADKFERLDGGMRSKRQAQKAQVAPRMERTEDFDDNELQQEMIAQPGAKTPQDLKGYETTPTKNQPNVLQATAFANPTESEDESSSDESSEWNDDMTVSELKEYAQSRQIDLSGKVRKSEIIDAIKEHEGSE